MISAKWNAELKTGHCCLWSVSSTQGGHRLCSCFLSLHCALKSAKRRYLYMIGNLLLHIPSSRVYNPVIRIFWSLILWSFFLFSFTTFTSASYVYSVFSLMHKLYYFINCTLWLLLRYPPFLSPFHPPLPEVSLKFKTWHLSFLSGFIFSIVLLSVICLLSLASTAFKVCLI